jgi:coproporphyrinogen III oxidase-like Fe-S oxidoreductase
MGLRLAEGIDPKRYAAVAGRPLNADRVLSLSSQGAIAITADGRLRVTEAGFPLLDAVVSDLAA